MFSCPVLGCSLFFLCKMKEKMKPFCKEGIFLGLLENLNEDTSYFLKNCLILEDLWTYFVWTGKKLVFAFDKVDVRKPDLNF